MQNRFLLFSLFCLMSGIFYAQNIPEKTFHVIDSLKQNTPLTKIYINGKEYLTDAESKITIHPNLVKHIQSNDTLISSDVFSSTKISFTSSDTKNLIKKIVYENKKFRIETLSPYSYEAYNKFIVQGTHFEQGEKLLNKFLNKLDYEIIQSDEKRHLVLSESMSKREYYSKINQLETVKWSKISGLKNPLFFSLNSQLQTVDIYKKNLKILGAKFVNPFDQHAINGYHYTILDSIKIKEQLHIKIAFHPKKSSRFESIKGFVWINIADYGIMSMYCEPVYGRKMKKSYAIQFEFREKHYTPSMISTTLNLDNVSSANLSFKARQTTYITDFKTDNTIIKNQFSDLILNYRTQVEDSIQRPFELSSLDSNTYAYFDKFPKQFIINKPLKIGEELYFGKIPTKFFNLHINKFVDFNAYEKVRTGIGLSSNDLLSEKQHIYTSMGFGWGDRAWKGDIKYQYDVLADEKLNTSILFQNDLIEAGGIQNSIYKATYNTEFMRRFQISRFNRQIKTSIQFESKPVKYLNSTLTFNFFKDTPMYSYLYKGTLTNQFREVVLNIRYAYGEQFFRFYDERLTLKSDYPTLWFTFEKSLKSSDFNYTRMLLRAKYSHQFIINGETNVEIIAGNYWGELPYFKLFNGMGSAELKATIHNSFETMGYNEFVASKFIVLFYNHNFGHFNFTEFKTFRPSIETSLNVGIGNLSNYSDHQSIKVKSFEKGYAEAGITVSDILLFYPFGIKIGLGASFYHRLLSYRYPTFKENSIFKITTGFLI